MKRRKGFIDYSQELKEALLVLRVLNKKACQKIIPLLQQTEHSVNELQQKTQLEQAILSFHLGKLRNLHLVTVTPRGRFRIYSLNKELLKRILRTAARLTDFE